MAEPMCEDEGLLQEWCPETRLLQQIPLKIQRGLFSQNLNLTCVDVVSEYIVIGTNLGIVYWYCRANGELQRLRLENSHSSISCVRVVSTVEYMVAAGSTQGTVTVFQIPKAVPHNIPDQLKPKQKQIERFTINGLHNAPVTNVEWSQNGMKLFSGDKNGVVVLTEIDFSLHISKSMELLNEQFEIVQLSHCQQNLLISTIYRSIICDGSNNWKVHQVGTKERKILGKFGATFCNLDHGLVLYASRPGHRLWLADKSGVVQQTLIFKSSIQSSCPKIQLINPVNKKEPYDTSFGKVIQFGDNKLITYNSEVLYVLHPGAVSVVSILNGARKILDLAVNENEIFILEGERSLLRISPMPDKYTLDMIFQPISRRTSFNLDEFAAKIKDTAVGSLKKITKDFISTSEEKSPNSPPALADEAVEIVPIVSLPDNIIPIIFTGAGVETDASVQSKKSYNWNNSMDHTEKSSHLPPVNINTCFMPFTQDCPEEIISRPLRKRHTRKKNSASQESESDTTSEDRLVWGITNDMSLSEDSAMSQSQSSFSVLRDISTLLDQQKFNSETKNFDEMKTSDAKSQTSLDTCESVSERLLMTPERFREEQEKTFARLANQSLLGSFSSGKTDNMSISLNMTTSSSVSSKISENLHSPCDISDSSSMVSRAKTADSTSTDNFQNNSQYLSKDVSSCRSNSLCTEDDILVGHKEKMSSSSSFSSRNSEEPFYAMQERSETEYFASTVKTQNFELDERVIGENKEGSCGETKYHEPAFFSECGVNVNGPTTSENRIHALDQDLGGTDCSKNQYYLSEDQIVDRNKEQEGKENGFASKALSSIDTLSYGPPSGSSMLSSQPSSDVLVPSTSQISHPQVRHFSDHWLQYETPEPIKSLAVSKNYVIYTDVRNQTYYSPLSGVALSWTLLDYKASMIRVSKDGFILWLLNDKKEVFTNFNHSEISPISQFNFKVAQNVRSFSIDSKNHEGYVVTCSGKIVRHEKTFNTYKMTEIPCDHIVTDIDCGGGMILVLTENDTVLCKPSEKENFRIVKTFNPTTTSLALGPENLLWVVDDKNEIYFSDDFLSKNPHWWQIHISDYIFQNSAKTVQNICSKIVTMNKLKPNIHSKSTFVAVNENSVWIYDKYTSSVHVTKTHFTGYMWSNISVEPLPKCQWQALSGEGVFEDRGRIWLLNFNGDLFCLSPNSHHCQSISVPSEDNVLCISSSSQTLWVLSESGRLYSRLGLTDNCLSGNCWRELKLPQATDNIRLIWVSCGCDVAWGCDINGRTFIGSPHHMATNVFDAAWVEVEGDPKGVIFEKVFVGPQLYMVWAIDGKGNLYVREGIFPHYQVGTSWVYVSGVKAVHVTISGSSVWALDSKGRIYRRCGISETNYIGDYWMSIPGTMKMITSSFTDELWGISHNNIVSKLKCSTKVLNGAKIDEKNKETYSSEEEINWEIVE